MGLGKQGFSYS